MNGNFAATGDGKYQGAVLIIIGARFEEYIGIDS
jgi:hypothetical protein